jgi:hypothetical protein
MSDRNNKIPVEDRLDIQELFAKYCWALDTGDADALVQCFTEDGEFNHLWQGVMKGRQEIRRAVQELWYDRPTWWLGRQHLANHMLMTPEGEGVRVKAFFSILQYNVDYRTNFVFGIGNWDNYCVKQDGQWYFKTVFINAWMDRDKVPWHGKKLAQAAANPHA